MTLGQILRAKRTEMGKSLEQVAAVTKIHTRILNAIEEDRYSELPARAFTRGFIVNYAKALKLDPNEFLKEHHEFLEQRFSERPTRDQGHQGYAFEGKEIEQNRRWMWLTLSGVGAFGLAVILIFKPGNHKQKEKHKEFAAEKEAASPGASPAAGTSLKSLGISETPQATESTLPFKKTALLASATATPSPTPPATTPSPTASTAPAATATPPMAATPSPSPAAESNTAKINEKDKLNKGDDLLAEEIKLRLTLTAETDTWVRYRSDARPLGVLILRKGKVMVIKAKERILFENSPSAKVLFRTAKAGNTPLPAPKVEMGANGEVIPYSGAELGKYSLSDTVPPPRPTITPSPTLTPTPSSP
jgi:cytoskeletal protein RodZ